MSKRLCLQLNLIRGERMRFEQWQCQVNKESFGCGDLETKWAACSTTISANGHNQSTLSTLLDSTNQSFASALSLREQYWFASPFSLLFAFVETWSFRLDRSNLQCHCFCLFLEVSSAFGCGFVGCFGRCCHTERYLSPRLDWFVCLFIDSVRMCVNDLWTRAAMIDPPRFVVNWSRTTKVLEAS